MKPFAWSLRIEAAICLLLALLALLLPELPIRLLSQAPVGSLVSWLDVVVLVRTIGCSLLLVAAGQLTISYVSQRANALAWTAALCRVVFGVIRWSLTLGALPPLAIAGWIDLALAVLTVYALLRSGAPVPERASALSPTARLLRWGVAVIAAAMLLALGFSLWWHLLRAGPEPKFASDEEHFKYAPLMKPELPGLPLYILEALPETFPEKLPGGWASLGLIMEPNRSSPVGFAPQITGFPSVTPNCALCHSTTYRTGLGEPSKFVAGAPAETLDFHGFLRFLFEAGTDPKFTDGSLMAKIKARHSLSMIEEAIYGQIIIPAMAKGLDFMRRDFSWMDRQPAAGPGRQDAGAVLKFNMLRLPYDGTLSTSDYRPIWRQHEGYALFHRWSGGGMRLEQENMLAAALFNLLQPDLLNEKNFQRMTNYFATLQPPKYPLPINQTYAQQGEVVFKSQCGTCHHTEGERLNAIPPLREVGTDGEYLFASTPAFLKALMAIDLPPFRFDKQHLTVSGRSKGTGEERNKLPHAEACQTTSACRTNRPSSD